MFQIEPYQLGGNLYATQPQVISKPWLAFIPVFSSTIDTLATMYQDLIYTSNEYVHNLNIPLEWNPTVQRPLMVSLT